jgi:hypothetical protein
LSADITTDEVARVFASIETESGTTLLALTEASPVLMVFLRQFGCSFCRHAIGQIADLRGELQARGVRPVFVHLGPAEIAKATFDHYGVSDMERINDPKAAVYQHPIFGLSRGSTISQMSKPPVWKGWFKHGLGSIKGDNDQMPGVFFLKGPKVVRKFVHKTIADEPDYLRLVG